MAKNIKTTLFCYDDHRGLTEDVRKRFSDNSRYTVLSFQTRDEFVSHLEKEKELKICKVAILVVHDTADNLALIDKLTMEIKRIDPRTGIILLVGPEKIEEIKKSARFNIDAYILMNSNSILRIHNIVKKLISEHNIRIFRKRSVFSLYILLVFLLLCSLLIVFAYFELPEYF